MFSDFGLVRANAYNSEKSIPVTLAVSIPNAMDSVVKCRVLFPKIEDRNIHIKDSDSNRYFLQIRTSDRHKRNIWIPKLFPDRESYSYEVQDDSLHGYAEIYAEGSIESLISDDKVSVECFVYLQPNSITRSPFGNESCNWETPFGYAKAVYAHRWDGKMIENPPELYDYIVIKITDKSYDTTPELLEDMVDYLNELCRFLSFLGKRYIQWYKLELVSEKMDIVTVYHDARITARNAPPKFGNFLPELPIKLDNFEINGKSLIESFFDSPDKSLIVKMIDFLTATYEKNQFVEGCLSFSYTALEVLVDNFTERKLIKGRDFKRLKEGFMSYLTEQSDIELSEDVVAELSKKIPEFQYFAYKTRLSQLFNELLPLLVSVLDNVQIDVDLLQMLYKAVGRRNKYIHAGKIKDFGLAMSDVGLVRFLITIWILHHLNYPISNINVQDDDLHLISWGLREYRNEYMK